MCAVCVCFGGDSVRRGASMIRALSAAGLLFIIIITFPSFSPFGGVMGGDHMIS